MTDTEIAKLETLYGILAKDIARTLNIELKSPIRIKFIRCNNEVLSFMRAPKEITDYIDEISKAFCEDNILKANALIDFVKDPKPTNTGECNNER